MAEDASMGWLKTLWQRHVLAPLPEAMDRRGYCNKTACNEGHFQSCPNRLKASGAEENADQGSPRSTRFADKKRPQAIRGRFVLSAAGSTQAGLAFSSLSASIT